MFKGCVRTIIGFLLLAGGLIITIGTFTEAKTEGGTYIICWGAILVGALMFFPGFFQFLPVALGLLLSKENPTNVGGLSIGKTIINLSLLYSTKEDRLVISSSHKTNDPIININDCIIASGPIILLELLGFELLHLEEPYTDRFFFENFKVGKPYLPKIINKVGGYAYININGNFDNGTKSIYASLKTDIQLGDEKLKILLWRADLICLFFEYLYKIATPDQHLKLEYWILHFSKMIRKTFIDDFTKINNKPAKSSWANYYNEEFEKFLANSAYDLVIRFYPMWENVEITKRMVEDLQLEISEILNLGKEQA